MLETMLGHSQPVWGLRLAKETSLAPATVYSLLARLERTGVVASTWEEETERPGPRRRLYELTEDGAIVAAAAVRAYAAKGTRAPRAAGLAGRTQ
ncbi:PadR family transcriptional regulator [Curtobacterium sp. MCPF17_031]|nr:PadR family transcriptional regulator [Curtobacterium sp. MCPF17_031]